MSTIRIDRLKEALADAGWSQSDLARSVGVTPAAIQQILSGKTRRSMHLVEIAKELGINRNWLLGISEDKHDFTDLHQNREYITLYNLSECQDGEFRSSNIASVDRRIVPYSLRERVKGDMMRYSLMTQLGDELAPRILHDDVVMLDMAQNSIDRHDGLWLIFVDEVMMLRWALRRGDGEVTFHTGEPSRDAITLHSGSFEVEARIVWHGHQM